MFYENSLLENLTPDEILVYLRKSRSDDPILTVQEVLEKHETRLKEWAIKNLNGDIPEDNKYREVVSGETIEDRPEIKKLLKKIENPRFKAVLVVEVQRLSRGDLEDAGRLIKLLRYTNTMIITPQRIYDLNNEYDREFFERELKRGNEFLEYTKKIMGSGRLLSVQQGNYIGSVPPYGYNKIFIKEGKKKCPTLEINKEEAKVVKMIFDMYVNENMGRTNIAHRLDALGIKPPKGEHWSPSSLKDMLENVHYIGKIKWNWRKIVKIVEHGEVKKTTPKSKYGEYLIYEGKHEAIISEELFNLAREKQGRNHRAKAKTKVRNPLAGLLYCQCGRAMSLRTYKSNGVERSAARLLCDNQVNCKISSCLYSEIIERVIKSLQDCIKDFEIKINNNDEDTEKSNQRLIKQLEARQKELINKEINQWEKYSEEGMPKEIFDKLNKKVLKEKEEVKIELKKAKEAIPNKADYEKKMYKFKDALETLKNDNAPAELKNQLLKQCIERIDYNREKAIRITKDMTDNKLSVGGHWANSPIDINIKFKV